MRVQHSFEKMKTATMFFLKTPSLVYFVGCTINMQDPPKGLHWICPCQKGLICNGTGVFEVPQGELGNFMLLLSDYFYHYHNQSCHSCNHFIHFVSSNVVKF